MRLSQTPTSLASGRKRRKPPHPPRCGCEYELSQTSKKQKKKLDTICDVTSHRYPIKPTTPRSPTPKASEPKPKGESRAPDAALRRSSRLRGNPPAPAPSPITVNKLKPETTNRNKNKGFADEKAVGGSNNEKGKISETRFPRKDSKSPSSGDLEVNWDSRLRPRVKNVGVGPQKQQDKKSSTTTPAKRKLLRELNELKECKGKEEEVENDDGFENGVSWARKSKRVSRVRLSKGKDQLTGSSGCARSEDRTLQAGLPQSNEEEAISPLKNLIRDRDEMKDGSPTPRVCDGDIGSDRSLGAPASGTRDESEVVICRGNLLWNKEVNQTVQCDTSNFEKEICPELCPSNVEEHVDDSNDREADLGLRVKFTDGKDFDTSELCCKWSGDKCTEAAGLISESQVGFVICRRGDVIECVPDETKDEDAPCNLFSETMNRSYKEKFGLVPKSSIAMDRTPPTAVSAEQLENGGSHEDMDADPDLDLVKSFPLGPENKSSTDVPKHDPISSDKLGKLGIKEGRRCGLCGGGVDGKPPKKLVRVSAESDTEAYDGLPASDETNYNIWDGFGDEPGWLGRLLGPINDRYGIAGVWVHQHCAVWSPEVYFAGLGCLKNVRAALCRGRALKCSRCGRPGATIGCRVDRCPKTYHLPCGRADGCIFDHRKFLIACTDHSHLFQPQGKQYMHRIKKMKARKMKLDMRKVATDAWRKDLEAEEKWLENCGEDEEFLRREGKRLHRDVSRIAPVYIGGSSPTSEKLYEGWESVAGLQDVIQCMKEVVILPLLYPDFFNNLGLTPPRGVLLHGYPGTGKTLVVRALVGACSRGDKRIAYFARKGADCLGKYVGDAERQLRLLFQVAEKSQPSIIFFDEIDGLAPRRTRQQDQTHSSVVSTLLALLDGLKSRGSVIVIGATNRPDAVDPALRRPGRFDREIFFPLPSVKDRSAILSLHTRKWPKPVSGSLLMQIAKRTGGFAGADLQALCTQAAMIALKRNCALHELLSAAERRSHQGKRLSLPSFVVEERDWFAALACAPPPCSRREAGMAVNSVVSSPLPSHLVSCLMQPLAELLISLYLDEHIVLPSALYNAAQLIEGTVTSALKRKNISTVSWWSHLSYLIREPDVLKEIERSFSPVGLLIDTFCYSTSDQLGVDNDDGNENLEYHKLNPAGVHMHANSMDNFTYSASKASGFRVLIGGYPRSGQRHLASCVLHGFEGHIEIKKVDLATISREGHGDLVQGITHILLKCQGIGPCIIYMPRIDLWALDETSHQASGKEMDFDPETRELVQPVDAGVARNNASHAWNSLVEQMDSMPNSFLMVLATFETTNHVLPLSIMEFFTCDVLSSTKLVPSKHTIPRFYVQLDGNFNRDMVIDASAVKLSRDLSQRYVQMIHSGTHNDDARMDFKINDTVEVHSQAKSHETENQSNHVTENQSSSKVDQVHRYVNDERYSSMSNATGNHKDEILPCSHQDSSLKNLSERIMVKGKSTLQLAIATFGYQILRYPHFAELCWATSKLKEGPSADINGPWKGWPFNSCVVYANGSSENVPVGESLSQHKNTEQYSVVRGLVAVGLLAYRGVYKSAREVSFEVRKVLELLVGQINARIRDGKDGYRFLRLLSQVAYLEDMVSSWVCTVQSLDVDNQQLLSKSKSRHIEESLHTDDHIDVSTPVKDDAYMANMSYNNCQELKSDSHDKSPEKFTARNNECVDLEPGAFRHGLPNSSQWCVYDCCSECFHALHIFTKKFLKDSWESGGCCSTIDDVHDIVASCSTNLLSEISRLGTAESFRNGGISAMECNCHLKSKNMGIKNACVISQSDPGLMLSQDFAHVPSDSNGDVQFHCKSEHLCLSSLIEKILKIKRPCD